MEIIITIATINFLAGKKPDYVACLVSYQEKNRQRVPKVRNQVGNNSSSRYDRFSDWQETLLIT